MKQYFKRLFALLWLLVLVACTEDTENISSDLNRSGIKIRTAAFGAQGAITELPAEKKISHLNAYLFSGEMLVRSFLDLVVGPDNICRIDTKQETGKLYFLANTGTDIRDQIYEQMPEDEFLRLTAQNQTSGNAPQVMSGTLDLASPADGKTVHLQRGIARIDLEIASKSVEVNEVTIAEVYQAGYLFPQEEVLAVPEARRESLVQTFRTAQTDDVPGLFYLYEQKNSELVVWVKATINGTTQVLRTSLPQDIVRNFVYTLRVKGAGAKLEAEVLINQWEMGNQEEGALDDRVSIDPQSLPENVTCDGNRVYISHVGNDFTFRLQKQEEVTVRISSSDNYFQVTPVGDQSSFHVVARHLSPGVSEKWVHLDVYPTNQPDVRIGRISLIQKTNPTELTGALSFDENWRCDFDRYIDGELGVFRTQPGKEIRVEADDIPWLKVYPEEGNQYRVVAGWKPNDPDADGRTQEGKIIICNTDGTEPEEFYVSRKNWGLPVVNINGTWWCKYNLRGNVKRFEDQILIADDPAAGRELGDYLATCTDEEFLHILGDQYQGGNPNGLPLRHNGSGFYYEGMKAGGGNFGTIDPTVMAPDGYQLPDYDDFRFFTANNNFNLGYGSNSFNNNLGQRLTFDIVERNMTFLGASYGPINFYDFNYNDTHFVLCGLGHQYNVEAGNLAKMFIILGTYGHNSSTWLIEGSSRAAGTGNWYKYVVQNTTKTRTLRCIKTPVEYVIE